MRRSLPGLLVAACSALLLSLSPARGLAAIGFVDAGTIGSPGSGPGQLGGPNGMAVDDAGNIYVADTYNLRINKYSSSGTFLLSWGSLGTGNGQFRFPYGIDVTSAGEVFVSDLYRHDVQVFSTSGTFLRSFGGSVMLEAFGLYASDDGNVYVADRASRVVRRFSAAGTYLGQMGPSFAGPVFNAPQNVEGREPSRVLVSDGAGTIHQVSSVGSYQQAHGSGVIGNPTGTAVLGTHLAITEYALGTVRVLDMATGVVEAILGDDEPFTFSSPFDAAFQGDSILLILEAGTSRIRRLRIVESEVPQVSVTAPPGGTLYLVGQTVPITWTATDDGAISSIDIAISRDGGTSFTPIANGLANTGSFDWVATAPTSNFCRIRVTARDDAGLVGSGLSPGSFMLGLAGPIVTVIAPNGGELYDIGSVLPIRWNVTYTGSVSAQISISRDDGVTWSGVGFQAVSTGALDWVTSGLPSEQCLIRVVVTASNGTVGSDRSDGVFRLGSLAGFSWSFAGMFGTSGSGPGGLGGPDGIAVSDDGRVYVADTYNSRVQWFDRDGAVLGQFGGESAPGGLQMSRPYGIDVDAAGHVYVGDFATRLVKKFSADGAFLGLIGDSATFAQPFGLWVSDEGTLYVTDRPARRVRLFSAATGAPIGVWGPTIGTGTLGFPQNIEGDGNGIFHLSDGSASFRVRSIDGGGQQIDSYAAPLGGDPTGAALAGSYFFLTEYNRDRLSVTDLVTGNLLAILGDNEPFTLSSPIDAATMGDSMLYVLDTGHNRVVRMRLPTLTPPSVQVLQPNGGEVVLFPAPLLITWSATDDVDVASVDILVSRDGGLSWSLIASELPNTGQYEWDMTGPSSDHCLVRVVARDASGGVGRDRSDQEFAIVGLPVPTLLVSLSAESVDDGIAVSWQLADVQMHEHSRLQRSLARDGSYSFVEGAPEVRSDGSRLIDRDVEAGRTYWYRIASGEHRFGPIAVESGARVTELSFAPAAPNPTNRATRLSFALPRAADVSLMVHDVSGREVAELVRGERPAGRHEVVWSGEDARGRVVPGLYFVRLTVQGEAARVQRVVLTP